MTDIQEFLESVAAGQFKIPVCASCGERAWPPSRSCPNCFSSTKLEKIEPVGILIEFANSRVRSKEGIFGVVDIEGIKVVGGLRVKTPTVGMKMKMAACGLRKDGSPFYDFEPV